MLGVSKSRDLEGGELRKISRWKKNCQLILIFSWVKVSECLLWSTANNEIALKRYVKKNIFTTQ